MTKLSILSRLSNCMMLMMHWLLIICCSFSILFPPVSSSSLITPPIQHECNSTELAALLRFKHEFQIITPCHNVSYYHSAYPKTSTWNNKSNQWDGIHCDPQTGHVIGIDLSSSCLYGPITSNSTLFSSLLHLQYLNIADTLLGGHSSIPLELGNLSRLVYLNMSFSGFVGAIPMEISKLSKLSLLDLSWNEFQGEFPASIFHLPNLQHLGIQKNDALQDYLPDFNSTTTSRLETLKLYGTNFSGNIPSSIGNLASLRILDMSFCKFSGTPPSSLGNLTQLVFLYLAQNYFAASNPMPLLSKLTMLRYLYLHDMNLEGKIPSSLGNLTQLYELDLSNNNLSGSIPNSLLNLPIITTLRLANNYLRGLLDIDLFFQPEHLNLLSFSNNNLTIMSRVSSESNFKRSSLFYLDISYNKLQGSLPIPPPSVKFYIAENIEPITGMLELPPTICSLTSLTVLSLTNSHLVGELPRCFENMSLQVLDLQNNYLHGSIPEFHSHLRMISLNNNSFQGKLPRSLARCSNLTFLDVGNNYINDTFPSWLESLPLLTILALKANSFHGSIGILLENNNNARFPRLRIIDLSMNKFSGNLPTIYFHGFDAMKSANLSTSSDTYLIEWTDIRGVSYMYDYSVTLADKGMELEFLTISDALIAIDLSQNRFHGEIPMILGNLTGLHLLNLSNNHITGPIPSSLAKLKELQSLDLSSNRLSGHIPQQLSQLPFVSIINVSYNNLTGLIPEGQQFNTFEDKSYLGNPGLCGKPLSRSCGNSAATPNHHVTEKKQNNNKLLLSTDHLVALIGLVGGLVFGAAMEDITDGRRLIQSWIRKLRWISLRRRN